MKNQQTWVVSQLGAREHYAVARALCQQDRLLTLVTDAWVRPGSPWRLISPRLAERFHTDLPRRLVHAFNASTVRFEAQAKLNNVAGWGVITQRNNWFQHHSLRMLEGLKLVHGARPTLFAYSYTALGLFKWAKSRGWRTVLGQIDGGIEEEALISVLRRRAKVPTGQYAPPPVGYWSAWQDECGLADRIVVNSEWSRSLLEKAGVAPSKLAVIPLAYEPHHSGAWPPRQYPARFDGKRPLRVLFLGQVGLRKGVAELLQAARALAKQPIEFRLVGTDVDGMGLNRQASTNVTWIGPVTRSETRRYYLEADVFIFPSHSDGFGLTQLEAFAHGLPVIASRSCGDVVADGINGRLLERVDAHAIEQILTFLVSSPQTLQQWAGKVVIDEKFSLESVGVQLSIL